MTKKPGSGVFLEALGAKELWTSDHGIRSSTAHFRGGYEKRVACARSSRMQLACMALPGERAVICDRAEGFGWSELFAACWDGSCLISAWVAARPSARGVLRG